MPKIENTLTCPFAVTLTVKPKLYRLPAEDQYKLVKEAVMGLFKQRNPKVTLIAEVTKQFNIHFHALLQWDYASGVNYPRWFHNEALKYKDLGFTCVKQAQDVDGWLTYISKAPEYIMKDDYFLFPSRHIATEVDLRS